MKKARYASHDQIAAMAKKYGWVYIPPVSKPTRVKNINAFIDRSTSTQAAALDILNMRSPTRSMRRRRVAAKRIVRRTKPQVRVQRTVRRTR